MAETNYNRVRYPDVAEDLESFENYKVFLQHWDSLSEVVRQNFEVVKTRRETRIVAIFGEQGIGKTIFANRLIQDLNMTAADRARGEILSDPNNLWHRIAGGVSINKSLISLATQVSVAQKIEGSTEWVRTISSFVKHQRDRVSIVIADNAERSYFCQGVLDLSLSDYLQLRNNPRFFEAVAQNLVEACREKMRGSLFIILANDKDFLDNLQDAVDRQHKGLMKSIIFPAPSLADKETIVRVNINRLNNFSYWYCIDRAGPTEKVAIYNALYEASSFREAFRATDNALDSQIRAGRPANKNLITLIVMHSGTDAPNWLPDYAELDRKEFVEKWASSVVFKGRWAELSLSDSRECGLLESEWQLRVVTLGNPFVQALFDADHRVKALCRDILVKLKSFQGAAIGPNVRKQHIASITNIINRWGGNLPTDLTSFWAARQARSIQYEDKLKDFFGNTFDKVVPGFIDCRPDLVVERFKPCKVLDAGEPELTKITQAVRREAHVFEFTAIQDLSSDKIATYLKGKLGNYVRTTQEQ